MRKATVLLAILLQCLLTPVVAEFCTVKAQGMSIDLEFVSSPPAYVNQPFEIKATVSGGTPPYTYQWYTKWFPPWKPGMDPALYVASSASEIAVSGATSATFWFTPTVEGIYWISVGVSDSAGQSVSRYPSIQPFQLIVHNPQQLDSSGTSNVEVSIISPQNRTYDTNNIELIVSFGAFPGVWYIGYSLDGGSYNEIAPGHPLSHNLTETLSLSQLPKGSHSIEVKATAMANDEDGTVIAFSKVYFTITKTLEPLASSSPTPTPSSTIGALISPLTITIIVTVAVLVAVIVSLFSHRRHRKTTETTISPCFYPSTRGVKKTKFYSLMSSTLMFE